MAATTSYYGKLKGSELGAGYVVQTGVAQFGVATDKVLSLSTKLRTIRYLKVQYKTSACCKKGTAETLYSPGTVTATGAVRVYRKTAGTAKTAYVWYELIGY